MRIVFEQSKNTEGGNLGVSVYENVNGNVYIGNGDDQYLVFEPDEAILLAKEIIEVAKQIKGLSNGRR